MIDLDPVPDELQDGALVIEAGAYEGAWTLKVCQQRPHCQVYAFEPATRAYRVAGEKLKDCPNVYLSRVALGKQAGTATLCDRERDGANTFAWNPENEPGETVLVTDAADVIEPLGEIGLMHLNAEGDEVTILERLIETDLIQRVKMILVQWHPYDDEMSNRIAIIGYHMESTHCYDRRGPWGCWQRKDDNA